MGRSSICLGKGWLGEPVEVRRHRRPRQELRPTRRSAPTKLAEGRGSEALERHQSHFPPKAVINDTAVVCRSNEILANARRADNAAVCATTTSV